VNVLIDAGEVVDINTWQHIAAVRYGDVWSLYVDGTLKASTTDAGNSPNLSLVFWIGDNNAGAGANVPFIGHIDELRISNVARWTSNFTPPTAPY
jgi:predicted membrane-bound spermidine synthase